MDHFISMYIDNELSLNEKILFVEQIRKRETFAQNATALLTQELILHSALKHSAPSETTIPTMPRPRRFFRSAGLALAACLVIVFSYLIGLQGHGRHQAMVTGQAAATHRFVIHAQESDRVEITGSFTNWTRVPLKPSGINDYWEVTLPLPPGEHRYSFILDGTKLLPDPTVVAKEADDFGAVNSILNVEV